MGKQIFCSQDNYHTINAHKRTSWSNVDDRLYIENNLTLFYLIENHEIKQTMHMALKTSIHVLSLII